MRRRLSSLLGSESLVIVVFATYALILLGLLSAQVAPDTWLALVAGRSVAHSGLPGDDVLTAWTQGVEWIDQQWLGQLAFYGLASLGGVKLVLLTHVVLAGGAFGLALAAARRRGGSQRMVARVGILALVSLVIVSTSVRTQSFAYVLFVAVLWLAAADGARPSKRALWLAPLLALWANLHGSVLLGAGLVALSGAIFCIGGLRTRDERRLPHLRHGLLLLAIGLLSPLVSPYAGSLGTYYAGTALNGEFAKLVTEWMSPRPSPATAAFYLLGGLALWSIGRAGDRLTLFERAVLVLTLAAGVGAIRSIIWFALAATMLVPVAAGRPAPSQDRRAVPAWLEAGLSSAALLAVLAVAIVVSAGNPDGHVRYPPRAAAAAWRAAQRDPSAKIFADQLYGDWLLWLHPSLAGRVVFDARLELLSDRRLHDILVFNAQVGPRWRDVPGDARILVLNRGARRRPLPELPASADVLVREGRFRRVAEVGEIAVLTRPTAG